MSDTNVVDTFGTSRMRPCSSASGRLLSSSCLGHGGAGRSFSKLCGTNAAEGRALRARTLPLPPTQQSSVGSQGHEPNKCRLPSRTTKRSSEPVGVSKAAADPNSNPLWLGVLLKGGAVECKRLWRREDAQPISRRPGVVEVFGPFHAVSFLKAKLELRAIMTAVGFLKEASSLR